MRKLSRYFIFLLAIPLWTRCSFNTAGLKENGPECGDGTLEEPEVCDRDDLAGQTCASLGYSGGTLACGDDCTFDSSGCEETTCGNGRLEVTEPCDDLELGGQTCASLGYYGGTLTCNDDCTLNLDDCVTTGRCGDGVLQEDRGETCDGGDLDAQTCETLGYYGGVLACNGDCTLDLAPCRLEGQCGDDALQDLHGEECDGVRLDDQTCETLGYYGGTLLCGEDCRFNLEPCAALGRCGDGTLQEAAGEACDGDNLNAQTCDLLGYYGGTLACLPVCELDLAPCEAQGRCGDTIIQSSFGEQCDSLTLGGVRCRGLGYFGGLLRCAAGCTFDGSDCEPAVLEGTATQDLARDMTIDLDGNVYAVGTTSGVLGAASLGGDDIVVVKWNVDGQRQWVAQLGTSGNDVGRGILLDPSGAVYVTGSVLGQLEDQTALGSSDVAVFKLHAATGARLWHRQFGSAAAEEGRALAMDASGNIYIVGHTQGTIPPANGGAELVNLGAYDIFLVRMAPNGDYIWGQMTGTPSDDYAIDLKRFATSNKLFISGTTGGALAGAGTSAGSQDVCVLRYSLTGTREQVSQFGSAASDQGFSLAFDSTHLYITGYTEGTLPGCTSLGNKDLFVAKLDPTTLVRTWLQQFGTSGSEDSFRILWNGGNSLFIGGSTSGTFPGATSAGGNDAFLFKLRVDTGALESIRQFGSPGNDIIYGLGLDPSGTVCMTGSITGSFMGVPSLGNSDLGVWCSVP